MKVVELDCFRDFYISLLLSFAVGMIFDLVRSIKIKNKKISDFISSAGAFFVILYVWVYYLGGSIRWYVIITLICGIVIYFFTLSRLVFPILTYLTKKTGKIYHFISKILLTLLKFSGKIYKCISRFFRIEKKEENKYEKNKI